MAENILQVSLKDYKKSIDELRGSLLGLDEASNEYKTTVDEIREREEKLHAAMTVGKKSMEGSANSLNAMKTHLKELRREFDGLDVGSARWKELQKEINTTTKNISEVEQGIGVFSRNVGNYSNSFIQAFGKMGGAAGTVASNIQGVKAGFDVLKVHPIMAVITALAAIFGAVANAISENEELTNRLNEAMSAFRPVIDLVTNALDTLAGGLVTVIEYASKAVSWLMKTFHVGEESLKLNQDIAKQENELNKQKRDNLETIAELDNKIAEAEEKVTDSELSVDERIAAQKQKVEFEKQKLALKKQELVAELALQEAEAQRGPNNKATNDKIAELKAQIKSIDGELSKVDRDSNRVEKKLNNEKKGNTNSSNNEALKAADEEKKRLEEEKKRNEQAAYDNLKLRLEVLEQGTEAYKNAAIELEEYEYSQRKKQAEDEITDEKTKNEQLVLLEQQHQQNISNIVKEYDDARNEAELKSFEEQKAKTEEFYSKLDLARQNDLSKIALDNEWQGGEDSYEYLIANRDYINQQLLELYEDDFKNTEEYEARKLELQKEYADANTKLLQKRFKDAQTYNNAFTSVLGGIGDVYEDNIRRQKEAGKISEEEAEKQFENLKWVRYAETVMNTAAGIMNIWADPAAGNTYIKAALSAALGVEGAIQLHNIATAKIGSTNGTTGGNSISASAAPIISNADYMNQMDMQNANYGQQDNRVYILESDIDESNKRVETREHDTTF